LPRLFSKELTRFPSIRVAALQETLATLQEQQSKQVELEADFAFIFERHLINGLYTNEQERFFDELLYITTAIKQGRSLDGDSLNFYVFDYLRSNQFRKDKISLIQSQNGAGNKENI
jgi:hypothetical protein